MRWSLVLLAACSFEHGKLPAIADAPRDTPPIDPDTPLGTWSTPVEITELTSNYGDDDPSLTDDLLEIYWGSRRPPSGAEDIWMASRQSPSEPWGQPVPVSVLNTADSETTIRVTSDGLAIFFTRSILNNADVYFSTRAARNADWSTPMRIDELSLSNDQEYGPYARADLLRIIFCRGTSVSNEALWVSERASTTAIWDVPNVIIELNESAVSECDPILINDRVLYYASDRTNRRYDIYRSVRADPATPFGALVPIDEVNEPLFNDRDVWVSSNERYMVFSSDRVGGNTRLYLSVR